MTKVYIIYMYYIYHIPGVKIGCTEYYPQRCLDQGYRNYELLETHNNGWKAGNREIELQKEYGLPVDNIHYMKFRKNIHKLTTEEKRRGAITLNKTKRSLTFEQAEEIRYKHKVELIEQQVLAKEHGLSKGTIWNIIHNKCYLEP